MKRNKLLNDLFIIHFYLKGIYPDLLPTIEYLTEHIKKDYPNWKKAPPWANWWTVDGGSVRKWWENKPTLKSYDMEWSCDLGRSVIDEDEFYVIDNWEKSLQEREK